MFFKLFLGIGLIVFVTAVYLLFVFKNLSAVSIGSRIPEQDQTRPALMVMDIQEGITVNFIKTQSAVESAERLSVRRHPSNLRKPVARHVVTSPIIIAEAIMIGDEISLMRFAHRMV